MIESKENEIALQTSPPYWCSSALCYAVRIEYAKQEFVLYWKRPNWQPNIALIPLIEKGVTVQEIVHSEEEDEIWKTSELRSYGSYSHVRESMPPNGPLPMYKLAHSTGLALQFLKNEFSVLTHLSSYDLPIVKVDSHALNDSRGIFGFRMEKLVKLSIKDCPGYYTAVEDAVHLLHEKDCIHGDLTISNIMLNDQGNVRLIDFGLAGKKGEPLPSYHPYRLYNKREFFEVDMDLLALKKLKSGFL